MPSESTLLSPLLHAYPCLKVLASDVDYTLPRLRELTVTPSQATGSPPPSVGVCECEREGVGYLEESGTRALVLPDVVIRLVGDGEDVVTQGRVLLSKHAADRYIDPLLHPLARLPPDQWALCTPTTRTATFHLAPYGLHVVIARDIAVLMGVARGERGHTWIIQPS